jgi:hypothetical protein
MITPDPNVKDLANVMRNWNSKCAMSAIGKTIRIWIIKSEKNVIVAIQSGNGLF